MRNNRRFSSSPPTGLVLTDPLPLSSPPLPPFLQGFWRRACSHGPCQGHEGRRREGRGHRRRLARLLHPAAVSEPCQPCGACSVQGPGGRGGGRGMCSSRTHPANPAVRVVWGPGGREGGRSGSLGAIALPEEREERGWEGGWEGQRNVQFQNPPRQPSGACGARQGRRGCMPLPAPPKDNLILFIGSNPLHPCHHRPVSHLPALSGAFTLSVHTVGTSVGDALLAQPVHAVHPHCSHPRTAGPLPHDWAGDLGGHRREGRHLCERRRHRRHHHGCGQVP